MCEPAANPPDRIATAPAATSPKYSDDIERVVKDYQESAKQLSDVIRYIGFGLVGLYLGFSNSTASSVQAIVGKNEISLLFVVLCGCLVVIFDYLNLYCRTQSQSHLIDLIDRGDPSLLRSEDGKRYLYDPKDAYYRYSRRTFNLKQIFAVIGCAFLIFIFIREFARAYF
jgi:hypothetical protein